MRERVVAARERQLQRAGVPNARLDNSGVRQHCRLDREQERFLESVAVRMNLSPRACQRILKVARTLADMAGSARIGEAQLAEAVAYRGIDCGPPQG